MGETGEMRRTACVARDEGACARRSHVRELFLAERGGDFGKLRAEHAAEAAALRHVGQFAHIAAAGLLQERRRAAVAMQPAQVAGVVAGQAGRGRARRELRRIDLELRLEELDELVGLAREGVDRGAVGGSRVEEPSVLLTHDRAARTGRRHNRVVGREDLRHPPREARRVGGKAVQSLRDGPICIQSHNQNLGRFQRPVFCCPQAYKSDTFDAIVQQKTPQLSLRGFDLSVIPLGLQVFSAFTSKSISRRVLFSLGESSGETPINSQRFKSFNLPLVFQCTGTNISKY